MALDYTPIINLTTTLCTILGGALTIQKINRNAKITIKEAEEDREKSEKRLLKLAKEEDDQLRDKLEARMEVLKAELKNLELSFNKDVGYIKEYHESEMAQLSEKIEALRDEIRTQNAGILSLLNKLIDKQ